MSRPPHSPESIIDRVVVEESGCWSLNRPNGHGYSSVSIGDRSYRGHRVVYEILRGRIRHVLHHRCENRACVNPWHLEDISHSEHHARHPRRKTVCKRGHDDWFIVASTGKRQCRTCKNMRHREYRAQKGRR